MILLLYCGTVKTCLLGEKAKLIEVTFILITKQEMPLRQQKSALNELKVFDE